MLTAIDVEDSAEAPQTATTKPREEEKEMREHLTIDVDVAGLLKK